MPDNTAESWGAFLLQIAEEAKHDAGQHGTGLVLHECLKDLAVVATAYAGRLGIEKGAIVPMPETKQVGFVDLLMGDTVAAPVSDPATLARLAALEDRIVTLPPVEQVLPAWLLETLRTLDERVTALENAEQRQFVTPSQAFTVEPVLIVDDDPTAWDSIDRARTALRSMVVRQHRDRAGIRQKVLDRVTALARQPGLHDDSTALAELRQHEARAQELAEIDAIAGVKLDEIAALDDLELARLYDASKGWPS